MWNDGGMDVGYGGNDGGFMSTQGGTDSPATQGGKKVRRAEKVVPVTLKSLHDTSAEIANAGNREAQMYKVVGLIQAVDVTSTKITYTINDTSGVMEVVNWLEGDQGTKETKSLMEMTYCQVFGSLRTHGGKKYILAVRIYPVEDINLITTHILEVMHAVLKTQQLDTLRSSDVGTRFNPNMGGGMENSLVGATGFDGNTSMGSGGFSGMHGLNANQNMVFQVIRSCGDEAGINREVIYQQLQGKINQMQINSVLDFLSSEGHIYSTVDEDHYKTTDG